MSRNFDFSQTANKGVTVLPDTTVPPNPGDVVAVSSINTAGAVLLHFSPLPGGTAGGGGALIGDTPPVAQPAGTLWWDSVSGQLYILYDDGSSTQWVSASASVGGYYLPLDGSLPMTGGLTVGGYGVRYSFVSGGGMDLPIAFGWTGSAVRMWANSAQIGDIFTTAGGAVSGAIYGNPTNTVSSGTSSNLWNTVYASAVDAAGGPLSLNPTGGAVTVGGKLNVHNIPLANADGSPPAGAISGDIYNNGGFLCITP